MTTDRLTLMTLARPGHVLLTLAGDCDVTTCDHLRAALEPVITGAADLVIMDLSGLAFLDSSGLRVLVNAQAALAAAGSRLVLVCVPPIVARILSLTGADQLIRVATTVEQALTVR